MSSLPWLALLAGLGAAYPLGWFLRTRPRLLLLAWTALGLLPFLGALDIGLVPLTGFLGDTHGMEVSLVDFLALALLFSRPLSFRRVPYRAAMALYFLVALFSVTQALLPEAALFYPGGCSGSTCSSSRWCGVPRASRSFSRSCRAWRSASSTRSPSPCSRGSIRYQSPGSFAHQNSLGMALNLFLMVPIALILARKAGWLTMLCPLAGLIAVVLTRSRGTLAFFLVGVVLVYGLSWCSGGARAGRRWSRHPRRGHRPRGAGPGRPPHHRAVLLRVRELDGHARAVREGGFPDAARPRPRDRGQSLRLVPREAGVRRPGRSPVR